MPAFISHKSEDRAIYASVCQALDRHGIDRWDQTKMKPGRSLAGQLREAINECEVCIFIATSQSVSSAWCLTELGAFWGAGKRVLLFLSEPNLAESDLPPQFAGDLKVKELTRLLEATAATIEDHARELQKASDIRFYKCIVKYKKNYADDMKITLTGNDRRALDTYERLRAKRGESAAWKALTENEKQLISDIVSAEQNSERLVEGEIYLRRVEGTNIFEGPLCYRFPDTHAPAYLAVKLAELSANGDILSFTVDQPRRPLNIADEIYFMRPYNFKVQLTRNKTKSYLLEGVLQWPEKYSNGVPIVVADVTLVDSSR